MTCGNENGQKKMVTKKWTLIRGFNKKNINIFSVYYCPSYEIDMALALYYYYYISMNPLFIFFPSRRNSVPFTPTQIEAIRAGMQPGLTMVN